MDSIPSEPPEELSKYWSGLPCSLLWDLPNPGVEPTSLLSPALPRGFFTTGATWKAHSVLCGDLNRKAVQKREDICASMADSLCYTAEIDTAV